MPGGTRRAFAASLWAAGLAGAALAGLALPPLDLPPGIAIAAAVSLGVVLAGALWIAYGVLAQHLRALERLRGAVVVARGLAAPMPDLEGEAGALARAIASTLDGLRADANRTDARLAAVVAALDEGICAVTDTGLVSLANAGASVLLGERRVGTSIYGALEPGPLASAVAEARELGRPVRATLRRTDGVAVEARVADLGEHGGAVLVFPAGEAGHPSTVELDLDLHDLLPPAPAITDDLPLRDLPLLSLDLETTGLDPTAARIVAVGAVRLHGARIYRREFLDMLVNPGVPIPPASVKVHGITDAMVADAPMLPAIWPDLLGRLDGCVALGHNIGFDLAVLRRRAEKKGLPWRDPPALDTMPLAAALDPERTDLNLDALAADHGLPLEGRHTALGDALLAAGLFVRLLPLLEERGVRTLGEARALAATARRVAALQRAAGW